MLFSYLAHVAGGCKVGNKNDTTELYKSITTCYDQCRHHEVLARKLLSPVVAYVVNIYVLSVCMCVRVGGLCSLSFCVVLL
jgi:hypothetical protein